MGGVREVLSRSDIDMFHEKPWAILTNLRTEGMAVEDGPRLRGSYVSLESMLADPMVATESEAPLGIPVPVPRRILGGRPGWDRVPIAIAMR